MQSKTFHVWLLGVLLAVCSQAAPYNTVILDGRPTEYDAEELRGTFIGPNSWEGNVITNLYVTWDATYLYVALQGWDLNDKLVVMIDVDPGMGTGATGTADWEGISPDYIQYNGVGWQADDPTGIEFGLDYMIASEGFYNNIVRITYDGSVLDTNEVASLFDHGNAATPVGSPVDMVVLADGTDCDLKGFEARIPWSVLYEGDRFGFVGGNVVPTGATLRIFANIHNNDPNMAFSSPDAIPANDIWAAGLLTTTNYIDVIVDGTDNGMPDDLALGNAPFLRDAVGKAGSSIVYARFNKPVTAVTVTNPANWLVNGVSPNSVTNTGPDTVFLFLSDPLPAAGSVVDVRADGVEDLAGDSKETYLCLLPSEFGLDEPLTVRFVLEANSGMGPFADGLQYGATLFYLNGGTAPLEWGLPPSISTPVTNVLSGSLRYADVIFPPGTPLQFGYKFSALLTGTGTNNYEAVRLDNYLNAERVMTLNTNAPGGVMYVTNRLGAAAAPLRGADVTNAYDLLYLDVRRGDAGVDSRVTVLFQLDLSIYDVSGLQRVLIQGTDPLRGFNVDDFPISDWAGLPSVGWANGGITLYDDGTNGDLVAGDGIYSRLWSMTTNGRDTLIVPGSPNALVGGTSSTSPFAGNQWLNLRTPRSFKYQFYVINEWGDVLNSPGFDIEAYIEPQAGTNIVFEPFQWTGVAPDAVQNPYLLPDPTNAPTVSTAALIGGNLEITYENSPDQRLHLVDVTDNLMAGFLHYGQRLPYVDSGVAAVDQMGDDILFARVRAARQEPYRGVQWSPNPVPSTGATVRIYFQQQETVLEGFRNVQIAGSFTGWNTVPMMFSGDGLWHFDAVIAEGDGDSFFKIRDGVDLWYAAWGVPPDGNYPLYKGDFHATWDPMEPLPGETFTLTYDAAAGPLAAAENIFAYAGFDELWLEAASRPMTNMVGTIWETSFLVPTNYATSVNFVFNNGGATWHNEGNGRYWRAFIGPLGE